MLNLLQDPWIPVRRRDGTRELIRPDQITKDLAANPVVDIAAPRPDFKAGLFQFLVGLLQSACPPETTIAWARSLREPPKPEQLAQCWIHLHPCFEVGGDGPRFMQDLEELADAAEFGVANLLIDAPGEKTAKDNTDHFVKAGLINGLCPACAASALLTLQLNAPSGGAGHRTSLRGGGPLTTFLLPDPRDSRLPSPDSLWAQLWVNVASREEWNIPPDTTNPPSWLPWTVPTRTSEKNEEVTPNNAHSLTALWATPRRIRLCLDQADSGTCGLCGAGTPTLIRTYRTRPRGANYVHWQHPWSPHYWKKPEEPPLPMHPQPGGLGFRHWPTLVAPRETTAPAKIITLQCALGGARQKLREDYRLRLWAFGYDLDNMKARSWQESRMPLVDGIDAKGLAEVGDRLVRGAEGIRLSLRGAIKDAWMGTKAEAKGDFGFVESEFWRQGEECFFQILSRHAEALKVGTPATSADEASAVAWQQHLRRTALALFDQWVLGGDIAAGNPRRMAEARNKLTSYLGSAKLLQVLGGAVPNQPKPPRKPKGGHS